MSAEETRAREILARALEAESREETDRLAQEAILVDPSLAAAYALRGRLAVARGDTRAAVFHLRAAFTRGDRTRGTCLALSICLEVVGEVELAARLATGQGPAPVWYQRFRVQAEADVETLRAALADPLPEKYEPALLPGERDELDSREISAVCANCTHPLPPGLSRCAGAGQILRDEHGQRLSCLAGHQLDELVLGPVLGFDPPWSVYVGTQTSTARLVAVRVRPTPSTEPEARARFDEICDMARTFAHPRAVALLGSGEAEGWRYLIHEYVEGTPLSEEMARGPMALERFAQLSRQLLGALRVARRGQLSYGHLRPEDIFVTRKSQIPDLKVIGLGLGPVYPGGVNPYEPAQARTEGELDLYAAALILYEALAGIRVGRAEDVQPFDDALAVPAPLAAALFGALSPDPAQRPESLEALSLAVREALDSAGVSSHALITSTEQPVLELAQAARERPPPRGVSGPSGLLGPPLSLTESDVACLRESPLLEKLAPQEQDLIISCTSRRILTRPGNVLFDVGAQADGAYIVGEGCLEVTIQPREGEPRHLTFLGPGEMAGELALVEASPRLLRVVAHEPTRVYHVDGNAFEELKRAGSPAAFKVLRAIGLSICARLRTMNAHMEGGFSDESVELEVERSTSPWERLRGLFGRAR